MSGPITPPLTVTTSGTGTPSGRPITTIKVSDGDLTISGNVATIDTSGGGAGAPADAEYLLAFDASIPAELTAARKLVINGNISMSHGAGANDDLGIRAVPTVEGVAVEGQIQFATSNVFDGIEEFYYDKPNGVLYAGTSITNGDASITILADGTGEPTLNLSNPTAAVSLTCDTNQQLKVEGGLNSFIFDASSATGGITWPDGTTQTTAASGGGDATFARTVSTAKGLSETGYFLMGLQGVYYTISQAAYTTSHSGFITKWTAPSTGTSDVSIGVSTASAAATNYLWVYEENSTGYAGNFVAKTQLPTTITGFQTSTGWLDASGSAISDPTFDKGTTYVNVMEVASGFNAYRSSRNYDPFSPIVNQAQFTSTIENFGMRYNSTIDSSLADSEIEFLSSDVGICLLGVEL